MQITQHAAGRMVQRSISEAVTKVVYAYGIDKGDKVVLTVRMAKQRLEEAHVEKRQCEAMFEKRGGSLSDTMHRAANLEMEIKALEQVMRTRGATVVCVNDTLITAYHGSTQIKIH